MNFLQISLNKDKLLEMDLFYRNYDDLSTTQVKASRIIVDNFTMEEINAFNNVHQIYDQVLLIFKSYIRGSNVKCLFNASLVFTHNALFELYFQHRCRLRNQ